MGRREFSFDGRDMYVLYTVGSWDEEGELWVGESSYTRLKTWRYTQKGWLFYSYCVPEPPEVAEVINTGAMLRVKPRPEEYLKTADRYLRPIGYQGNNLFCSEWSEDHLEELDFNGLFQYLYAVQYGCHMDEEFYREGIPGDVFEELEERYLPVTAEQLRQYAVYDGEKNSYAWKVLGYGNNTAGALGRSVPEITGMVRREDNTVVLTVDAVSGEMCDDAVFSHVLTVRFREDGSVQYLANQIPEAERERIPPYRYRLGASVNSIDDAAL